ncbi:MAG: DUF3263 domain-containing protein [Propionibacteriaceae bacterium]|jgi:hypothetical protein|nr:DUF3263 domain-containing protein [Propionibacteriaceae bacterium]
MTAHGEKALARLSERDRAVLAFERLTWARASDKEQAIQVRFGLTAAQYYQAVNALIDDQAAMAADPLVVKRLRRKRSRLRARRDGSSQPAEAD